MTIALSEFWTRLVQAGVTTAAGCRDLAKAYTAANAGDPPSNAGLLARFLVEASQLNDFQAAALLTESPITLRVGDFVRTADAAARPLSRWLPVGRVGACETIGLLFPVTNASLVAGAAVDLQQSALWLQAHAAIASESLQPIELYASTAGGPVDLVVSQLDANGAVLAKLIEPGRDYSAVQAAEIGIGIARALESLHAGGLVHGAVRADRVWCRPAGDVVLLRDAVAGAESPLAASSISLFDPLEPPARYAAPEFLTSPTPTAQTDLYGLGCLLFRLVVGRDAFAGETPEQTMQLQQTVNPPELVDAVSRGEAGDPLMRVIAFAMAKNPAARFASAGQFADALVAISGLLKQSAPRVFVPVIAGADQIATAATTTPPKIAAKNPQAVPVKKTGVTKSRTSEVRPEPVQSKPPEAPPQTVSTQVSPPTKSVPKPPPSKSESEGVSVRSEVADTKPAKPKKSTSQPPVILPPNNPDAAAPAVASTQPSPPIPSVAADMVSNGPDSQPELQIKLQPEPSIEPVPEVEVTESAVAAPDSPPSRPLRKRKKKKSKAPMILGAMCVPILMLLIMLIVYDPSSSNEKKSRTRLKLPDKIPSVVGSSGTKKPTAPTPPVVAALDGYHVAQSETLLWAPPYPVGNTAPLNLLPPGPAVVVSVLVEKVLPTELYSSMQPEFAGLVNAAASRSKVSVDQIQRCTVALHPGESGWAELSLAIELKTPKQLSDLTETWGVAASRTPTGDTIYAGDEPDSDAYFVIADEGVVTKFAVGSIARMMEVAELGGGAIPLPRSLQKLWDQSSDQASVTVMATPNFLFADGRELLATSLPQIVKPLRSLLIPDVSGALLTATVADEKLFAELRLAPAGGVSQAQLTRTLDEQVKAWPTWAENFVVDNNPDSSWRLLAIRMPAMLKFVSGQVRVGVAGGLPTANVYLPDQAAAQVSLATMFAMNTTSQAGEMTVASDTRALTLDEMLDRKMSVSFDQESLEFAIDAIVDEFAGSLPKGSELPPVRIIGSDLEKMGITQNQQIRNFAKTDIPLRTVLTDLVLGANPDKTATGPADPKQALVWVISDDPESPGNPAILVTTRVASQDKYTLPKEFQ